MYKKGRAWIEINYDNLKSNVTQFQHILPRECKIMAAVKANAYGHGALEVSHVLQEAGVEDFCVASLSEGVELRQGGIEGQILVLGYTHPKQFEELNRYQLSQSVIDARYGRQIQQFGQKIPVHIEIDTGMHRLGERFEHFEEIRSMWDMENLDIIAVYSHLCVADSGHESHREHTIHQFNNYKKLIENLKESRVDGFKTHISSSYGVLNYPEYSFDYVRLGIALYGILSSEMDITKLCPDLHPVLSLKARIQSIRTLEKGESVGYGLTYTADCSSRIATVAIGYADGIPRSMSNKGYILIRGRRAPIIGRISMDQMTVDITDILDAEPGDEAVVLGKSGEEEITATMFSTWADTITNEILSRLGSRLERVGI